jgi:hypothetical protein
MHTTILSESVAMEETTPEHKKIQRDVPSGLLTGTGNTWSYKRPKASVSKGGGHVRAAGLHAK